LSDKNKILSSLAKTFLLTNASQQCLINKENKFPPRFSLRCHTIFCFAVIRKAHFLYFRQHCRTTKQENEEALLI